MKLLRTSILAATLALGASVANVAMADDVMPPTSGTYLGLSAGLNSIDPKTFDLNGAGPAKLKFKDGWGAFVDLGYKWDQGFRTELEFGHSDNNAKDLNANTNPVTGEQRNNALMANILYDVPTGSAWTPYIGGGLGVAWLSENRIHTVASPIYDGTSGKFAWQGIAGVAYTFATNWQATAEFRYRGSNDHSYNGNVAGASVTRYDDRERDILVGIRYTFGEPRRMETAATTTTPPPPPAPAPMAAPAAPPPAPAAPEKFLVFFDFDKSNLRDDAQKIVEQAAEYAKHNGKTVISATGHTDTMGTSAYNMALSERRAHAVQKQLEKLGIPASEIVVHWKGKSEPLVATGDGVKEPQNRRVEIIFE